MFKDEWAGFVMDMEVRRYSKTTVGTYIFHLKPFLLFLEDRGIGDLRRVTREDLLAYQVSFTQSKTREGKPYRWGTLCCKTRVVKRFFEYLEKIGKVLLNPAETMKEPRRESHLPRVVLNEEQARKLLEVPDLATLVGVRNRALLEVFYSTGVRLSELLHLQVEDVDFEGGLLRVNLGKGAKDRVVPLGETSAKVLRGYVTKVRPLGLKLGQEEKTLFLTNRGQPMSKVLVEMIVRESGREAGLMGVTPHVLRHSFATQLVRNGAPVEVVSRMLGHSCLSVTHIYAHVAGVDMKRAHQESHPREKEDGAEIVVEAEPKTFKECARARA